MVSLPLWPATLLPSHSKQCGGTCLLCTWGGFIRGALRRIKDRNLEDVQTNARLLLFQPETSVIFPLSKIFAWNKERSVGGGGGSPN